MGDRRVVRSWKGIYGKDRKYTARVDRAREREATRPEEVVHVERREAQPIGRTDYVDASTEWACTRKKAYPDEKFARKVVQKMRDEKGADVVVYACTRCGYWHIGRAPGSG